jgi:hypothetical protein
MRGKYVLSTPEERQTTQEKQKLRCENTVDQTFLALDRTTARITTGRFFNASWKKSAENISKDSGPMTG